MALRAAGRLKSAMANSSCGFATSTSPRFKPLTPTMDQLLKSPEIKAKAAKGDFVPVCVAIGMIVTSVSFGLYTAYHQLGRAPNVFVKKSKRETLPEVVEPEHVAEEADKFVKRSFFRKVAHIQDHDDVVPYPIRGDVYQRWPVKMETLKDIGVEPKTN